MDEYARWEVVPGIDAVHDPRRVGKQLRRELAGIWSTRRGTYRVLYRIRENPHEVIVLRIEHRSDVYRPR